MAFEIERKFLVARDDWQAGVTRSSRIRQAYLHADGKASIRVRIREGGGATLTIKSGAAEMRRLELEYQIPVLEAESLMSLRQGHVIEKVRHLVPYRGFVWEVDVFEGENAGLVLAEVELEAIGQDVALPAWIGQEVTSQKQYYNGSLTRIPFSRWSQDQRALASGG